MVTVLAPFQVTSFLRLYWCCPLSYTGANASQNDMLVLWLYGLSCLSSAMCPGSSCERCILDGLIMAVDTTVIVCSLLFDQLCISEWSPSGEKEASLMRGGVTLLTTEF